MRKQALWAELAPVSIILFFCFLLMAANFRLSKKLEKAEKYVTELEVDLNACQEEHLRNSLKD